MRARFGIVEGTSWKDCMVSWCCHCCALVQEEKESLLRTAGVDPKTGEVYCSPDAMSYVLA